MSSPKNITTPTKDAKVCLGIIIALLLPAAVALSTARVPQSLVELSSNPSPFGYTFSLALFIIPTMILAQWFLRHPDYSFQRKSFLITVIALTLLGFGLDILFAAKFFTFNNYNAHLPIMIPVVGGSVPIEEFIFYVSGFLATLLLYIWCDEYWLGAYNLPDYAESINKKEMTHVIQFHPFSLKVGLILIGLGILFKLIFGGSGFPSYFIFLVVCSIVPSMLLLPTVIDFINWRALSFTFFLILLVSLLWEVTLASPYQWWNYQEERMLGLYIDAWTNLPVEAVIVWMAVSYMTVIVYETIKIMLTLNSPWHQTLHPEISTLISNIKNNKETTMSPDETTYKALFAPLERDVLFLFFAGLIGNIFYTHYSIILVVSLYIVGLTFEYLTKSLWTYNDTIKNSRFTIKGVNIILGAGWVGVLLLGACLAKFLMIHLSISYFFIALVFGIGIVGNLAEQLYYYLKLFSYNLDQPLLAFPFKKVILIYHLPLSVRLGYFSSLPIVVYLVLKLTGNI
jgi:hypothetical protein